MVLSLEYAYGLLAEAVVAMSLQSFRLSSTVAACLNKVFDVLLIVFKGVANKSAY